MLKFIVWTTEDMLKLAMQTKWDLEYFYIINMKGTRENIIRNRITKNI